MSDPIDTVHRAMKAVTVLAREVNRLRAEVERLRGVIAAVVDAENLLDGVAPGRVHVYDRAMEAARLAITPKDGPIDIDEVQQR